MNVKKNEVALIRTKINKKMTNLEKSKVGRKSKFQQNQIEVLDELLQYKPNGYLSSKLLLLKWLMLCRLPANYITVSSFHYILKKKFRFSYKKNCPFNVNTNYQKHVDQRYEFVLKLTKMIISKKRIIFIDEVGFNMETHKNYGWCRKGEKLQIIKGNKSVNYSLIGATSIDSFTGCIILKGSTNSEVFCAFMSQLIIHLQWKGFKREEIVFVMDHAKCHQKYFVSVFENRFNIIWTASYSPQFNPIELFWAQLKRLVYTKEGYKSEDQLLYDIVNKCFAIKNEIVRNNFAHTLNFYEKALEREDFP